MSESMLERAALAVRKARMNDITDDEGIVWTVVEAMREPSEGVLSVGAYIRDYPHSDPWARWRAMIDAILAGK